MRGLCGFAACEILPERMSRLRLSGTIMVILGGVLVLIALAFLPYVSFGKPFVGGFFPFGGEPTLWDLSTREPVILTVVGVAAIVAAAGDLLLSGSEPILLVLATGFSFYLFGRIFPVGFTDFSGFRAGFWLATAAAVIMIVGGVLAVARWRFGQS
jgi:hypothetical protein